MGRVILTLNQQKLLSFLSHNQQFADSFYLTGGTALAEFYLKHRYSEDLDFFSQTEIDSSWLPLLQKQIKQALNADRADFQQSFNRNLIFFKFGKDILKTEFTYFPFQPIEKPKVIKQLKIDSILDIAVNKFFTIYQSPSARHFIDLYLILKTKKVSWEKLAKLARIKFDTVIDPLQLGTQLITASEVKDLPKMIIKLPEKSWQNYFRQRAAELKKELV